MWRRVCLENFGKLKQMSGGAWIDRRSTNSQEFDWKKRINCNFFSRQTKCDVQRIAGTARPREQGCWRKIKINRSIIPKHERTSKRRPQKSTWQRTSSNETIWCNVSKTTTAEQYLQQVGVFRGLITLVYPYLLYIFEFFTPPAKKPTFAIQQTVIYYVEAMCMCICLSLICWPVWFELTNIVRLIHLQHEYYTR